MKNSKVVKVVLFIAGLIGMIVGAANLFVPVEFNASSGIVLGDNISLLNEMRASGGGLFMSGVFIMIGVFVSHMRFASVLLAVMIYLGYGLSRLVSISMDGMPSEDLVIVTGVEIVVGLVSLFVLYRYKGDNT